jgi:hypothetical protein
LRIPPSEAIVVVDAWRWRCFWRVVRRRLETGQRPRIDAPSGQTIDIAFLRYIWNYPTITRPFVSREIQRLGATKTLVELKSGADIPRFLQRLRQAADRGRLDS